MKDPQRGSPASKTKSRSPAEFVLYSIIVLFSQTWMPNSKILFSKLELK